MRLTLLALFAIVAPAFAGNFDEGNKAYDAGKFLEARQHYEAAVSAGEWTANLFYNLGNADERIGAIGLAALNYERALALEPKHAEARANLKFLRGPEQSKRTWKDIAFGGMSLNFWILCTAALAWAAVFTLLIPFARGRRLGAGGVFVLVLIICATAYAAAGVWQTMGELDRGIVIANQVEARQGPADRANLAAVLPAGSRVRVLSIRGEWTYCVLPDGTRGWIPSDSVEQVRLSS